MHEPLASAELWRQVLTGWRPGPALMAEQSGPTIAFEGAIRRLMASERAPVGADATVLACHGAHNAMTHALASLEVSAPVLYPAGDLDAGAAILRSGHESVAVPAGALVHRARRQSRCGVLLGPPNLAPGAVSEAGLWEALIALARRCVVVVDDTRGFVDDRPRPLGRLVDAGGVVVSSLDVRLGAPSLHVGWLIARGDRADLARESIACESRGVAPLLLDLAACAIEAAIAEGLIGASSGESLLMRL